MTLPHPLPRILEPVPLRHLESLNAEQRAAVLDPSRGKLVLAGAGSGKTRVLVATLLHLLHDESIHAESLLAFSFTRKACAEINQRLRAVCSERSLPSLPPLAFTFHSFAWKVIREGAQALALSSPPEILSGAESMENPGDSRRSALEAFEQFLAARGDQKEAPARLWQQMRPGVGKLVDPQMATLEDDFLAWKRAQGLFELEDLVPTATLLIRSRAGDALRERLKVVLVDEFQDIDRGQQALFCALLGPETRYVLYGDDDQAIYRWRGASPEFIGAYHRRCDVKTHLLTYNFRCRAPILALANAVISEAPGRVAREARAWRRGGAVPICYTGPQQVRRLALRVMALHEQGWAWESMAILVRDHADGRSVQRMLVRQRAPVTSDLNQPGVRILTYHAAKGLEFPVVFMPFLDRGRFPNTQRLAQERRMLAQRLEHAEQCEAWLEGFRVQGELRRSRQEPSLSARMNRLWTQALRALQVRRLREALPVADGVSPVLGWRLRLAHARDSARWLPVLRTAWQRQEEEEIQRLAEERRLCYVAMTRAQERLLLFCSRKERCSEFLRGLPHGTLRWHRTDLQ